MPGRAAELAGAERRLVMRNQIVELGITVIVALVVLWVIARLLPLVAVPEPWGSIVLVVCGAVVVVWALRGLKA